MGSSTSQLQGTTSPRVFSSKYPTAAPPEKPSEGNYPQVALKFRDPNKPSPKLTKTSQIFPTLKARSRFTPPRTSLGHCPGFYTRQNLFILHQELLSNISVQKKPHLKDEMRPGFIQISPARGPSAKFAVGSICGTLVRMVTFGAT